MTFKINKVLILFITFFAACSNNPETYDPGETAYSMPFMVLDLPDNIMPTIDAINKIQYAQNCIREVYYYCPPLDEINRAKAIVDICRDNKVLSISDCEEVLECIPTNGVVKVEECINDDGVNGFKSVYCHKGFFEYGECVPCDEEICDGEDNDCDGEIDEGEYPCYTDCGAGVAICVDGELKYCNAENPEEEICDGVDNDCNGETDENQLNKCNQCGLEPVEVCDGIDNNCDGLTDEDLLQECNTACEVGIEYCVSGLWYCTAAPPKEEICDGFDNDCDGLIDEKLDCLCSLPDVGKLIPCKEGPLVCGAGYKSCECTDETCTEFTISECLATCHWIPSATPPGVVCDKYLGEVKPEECNNHDDNCNQMIDENLVAMCYDGPIETVDVGICKVGEITCAAGYWGNYDDNNIFVPKLCLGQIVPAPADICNGADSNCDGMIDEDKELEPTDILFIVDLSGSMDYEINAVFVALNQFATYYSDADVVKWGVLLVAVDPPGGGGDYMHLLSNLTSFQNFINNFSLIPGMNFTGGNEMTYDAIYLAIHNITAPANLTYAPIDLKWIPSATGGFWSEVGESVPPINNFNVSWRDDANHVIILFTDEEGQSYLEPQITQDILVKAIEGVLKLKTYVFSVLYLETGFANSIQPSSWGPITLNNTAGKFYELTNSAVVMYNNLLEILDETACEN